MYDNTRFLIRILERILKNIRQSDLIDKLNFFY